jgi:hypothetical protein
LRQKLSNRADARIKLDDAFEHVTFDGAMQLECMSSEESDFDADAAGVDLSAYPRGSGPLQTRGYGWRSARLLRFYALLDETDAADASARPKRGVGRRERVLGPPKDRDGEGFGMLPPRGVAGWMVSRQWVIAAQAEFPDVENALRGVVVDDEAPERLLAELGPETDGEEEDVLQPPPPLPPPVHHYSTSSLNCALA